MHVNDQSIEVKCLLIQTEVRFGAAVKTPSDFERLRTSVNDVTGELLSLSTLKRLWGYVGGFSVPRYSTLDILSRYVGCKDFKEFKDSLDTEDFIDSRFFGGTLVRSEDLEPGKELILCWNPDRRVKIEYMGDDLFRVVDSGGSKLENGDRFTAKAFIQGQPLYLTEIIRGTGDASVKAYVAGLRGGLTSIMVLP